MTEWEFRLMEQHYWNVMPEWMRKAYHSDALVHHLVEMCIHREIPSREMVGNVAEGLFKALLETKQSLFDAQNLNILRILKP